MARIIRFRLCDEDRAQYGGEEWVPFDVEKFNRLRARELEGFEAQTGVPLRVVEETLAGEATARGVRALVWIARSMGGLRTPFGDFDIHTRLVQIKVDADGGPEAERPLDGSSSTSETMPDTTSA